VLLLSQWDLPGNNKKSSFYYVPISHRALPLAPPLTPPPLLLASLSPVHLLSHVNRASEGSLKIASERGAAGAYAIGPAPRVWRRWHLKNENNFKKDEIDKGCVCGGCVGGVGRATTVRRCAARQQSDLRLRLPLPGVGREMQPVRKWGGWLNDFTSPFQLQQLSHLYCNANPRPVPDGAFPASWVHRNMIIYPEHF